MKKLILLRHAKSCWADPELDDHDRPLNRRGEDAAPVIAAWLAERGHLPDTVLCSSALRARQTLERMHGAMPGLPAPLVEPGLYHAAPRRMLARLADLPAGCACAMLVGHNPGLGALARRLAAAPVRPRCARAFEHFPTAAAAVFTFDVEDWSQIGFGAGSFVDFARPRELAEA